MADKHPGGRPSKYSDEIVKTICERIATSTKGITRICDEDDSLPTKQTIYNWLWNHSEFFDKYVQAKESQMELMSEEILTIADDTEQDVDEGGVNYEHIQRSKLRIDTRKWLMSKLAPRFKDKQEIDHTTDGEPLTGFKVVIQDETNGQAESEAG